MSTPLRASLVPAFEIDLDFGAFAAVTLRGTANLDALASILPQYPDPDLKFPFCGIPKGHRLRRLFPCCQYLLH
eukprot:3916346-Prymnesium_polylepis.1